MPALLPSPLTPPAQGFRPWCSTSWDVVRSALREGMLHLALSVFCIQGIAVLAQLVVAHLLGPNQFGSVRGIEVSISIALILGTMGMSTLAVKYIAECAVELRALVLGRLLKLCLVSSLLVAALLYALAGWIVPGPAVPYLRALAWVLPFTAVGRTALNYFQGTEQFKTVAAFGAILAAGALPLIVIPTRLWGLEGWLRGRYLSEGLFLVGILCLLRRRITLYGDLPPEYAWRRLLQEGSGISISLLIRSSLDGSAVLMLGWILRDTRAVGEYGLAQLLVSGLLVLPGTLPTMYLPKIAALPRNAPERYHALHRVVRAMILATGAMALATVLCGPLLPYLFGSQYRPTVPILMILALLMPFRGVAASGGVYLLSMDEIPWMVWANCAELVLLVVLYAICIRPYGLTGTAAVTVGAEALVAYAYLFQSHRVHRRAVASSLVPA